MDLALAGRRALVTGGSRGIGKAIALSLAREGVAVALLARSADTLAQAADDLAAATGTRPVVVVADTRDDDAVTAGVASASSELGGIDILVNNASTLFGSQEIGGLVFSDIAKDVDVKVLGYLRCAQAVAPAMCAQGWGRIISIGGTAVHETGRVTTSMRNASIVAASKNLADQLGRFGVTVNTVHPGDTRTERDVPSLVPSPMIGRLVDASDVAALVTFLASPLAAAITGESIACGGVPGTIFY